MISKYSEKNKFGGYTYHIKVSSLFHIFINETTSDNFVVDIKEWMYLNYKVRDSFVSNVDLITTIKDSLDKLHTYLNVSQKYSWDEKDKNNL